MKMRKTVREAPAKAIREVKKEIVSKFPEMKGVKPSVVKRRVPADTELLSLIEQIDGELGAKLAGMKRRGTVLRKVVRVTFDGDGHILKLVSSK
jgi:hypothetical protein